MFKTVKEWLNVKLRENCDYSHWNREAFDIMLIKYWNYIYGFTKYFSKKIWNCLRVQTPEYFILKDTNDVDYFYVLTKMKHSLLYILETKNFFPHIPIIYNFLFFLWKNWKTLIFVYLQV